MLNLHLLECTLKGYDHISDLLLAKYWVITGCKYSGCSNLQTIICKAIQPPSLGTSNFSDIPQDAIVIVPKGFENLYMSSDWKILFEQ